MGNNADNSEKQQYATATASETQSTDTAKKPTKTLKRKTTRSVPLSPTIAQK
jgi:hypothetical protein